MELWELSAREAIRDTVARYAHGVDRGRFDDVVALFAEDGVLEVHGEAPHLGRAAIRSFLSGVKSEHAPAHIRHNVTNLQIDVLSPSEARGFSYFVVITEIGVDHWGRYRDTYTANGDTWHFAHRYVRTDGYTDGSTFA